MQEVIEQVNIRSKPEPDGFLVFPLVAVTLWARANPDEPGRAQTLLTFWSPSGKLLGSFEHGIDLSEYERLRSRRHFDGLPVTEPGRHVFRMEIQNEGESEWRQVAAIPLSIDFQPLETEQAESESK